MNQDAGLVGVLTVLGNQTRSKIAVILLAGEGKTAGQLGQMVGMSPSALSYHLRLLLDSHLLRVTRHGRTRIFALANGDIADGLEALLRSTSPVVSRTPNGLNGVATARSCYDHLAGQLGVDLADALVQRELLRDRADSFEVSPAGEAWFVGAGVDMASARAAKRSFARHCLDWTERRPHVGGALGAELLRLFLARDWVRRISGSRALKVTPAGAAWLSPLLGPRLRPALPSLSQRPEEGANILG